MTILSANFSSDGTEVFLVLDDGNKVQIPYNDGLNYQYTNQLNEWLEAGNEIAPYKPYTGLSFDQYKDNKREELKQARNAMAQGKVYLISFLNNTYYLDLNRDNRSNMHQNYDNAIFAGIALTTSIEWKMADNEYHAITYEEIADIGIKMGVYINEQFVHEKLKLIELAACATDDFECVLAIGW